MRADAARNLDKVLATGARLLATDPATSIATIAAEAGVDRRTVYRRFDSRETLLEAIYEARYDAVEKAVDEARLTEAPVAVALHRYVEGVIATTRKWPVELQRLRADSAIHRRRADLIARVDGFITRGIEEGLFRPGLPEGWISALLVSVVHVAADEFPGIEPAQAADFAVDTLLHGVGKAPVSQGR